MYALTGSSLLRVAIFESRPDNGLVEHNPSFFIQT